MKQLLRLFCVNDSKDANGSEAGMTSGDNKHKSKDVIEDTLQLPVSKTRRWMTRNNPSAQVFPPSGRVTQPTPSISVIKREKRTENNDDACGSCGGLYSDDAKNQNGAEWTQWLFCHVWYHTTCRKVVDELQFMCDGCEDSDDSE